MSISTTSYDYREVVDQILRVAFTRLDRYSEAVSTPKQDQPSLLRYAWEFWYDTMDWINHPLAHVMKNKA